jgi:SAM-dependent methyltransferase
MDLSPKMAAAYNALSGSQNLSTKLSAIEGDLLSPSSTLRDPKFFNFDIIVMSMALHHIADAQLMIEKLQTRLRDGGILVIVDWLSMGLGVPPTEGGDRNEHEGEEDGFAKEAKLKLAAAAHVVAHWGFSKEEMKALFENAGMVDVGFMDGIEKSKVPAEMNYEQQMFIAKARKVRNH